MVQEISLLSDRQVHILLLLDCLPTNSNLYFVPGCPNAELHSKAETLLDSQIRLLPVLTLPSSTSCFLAIGDCSQLSQMSGRMLRPALGVSVLGVPLLYLQSSQRIIGLPAISAANLYVISQTRKTYKLESSSFSFDQTQGEGIRTGTKKKEGLLLCPWEISFL